MVHLEEDNSHSLDLSFLDVDPDATHLEVVINCHNSLYLAELQMGLIVLVEKYFAYSASAHLVVKDFRNCWKRGFEESVLRDTLAFVPANSANRDSRGFVTDSSMNFVVAVLGFQGCSHPIQVEPEPHKPALNSASFLSILVFLLSNLVSLRPILVVATKEDLLQRREHD